MHMNLAILYSLYTYALLIYQGHGLDIGVIQGVCNKY